MTVKRWVNDRVQYLDGNGDPLSGGKIYFYEAGSSTPEATYNSDAGDTANANPVILDSAGRPTSEIWLTGGQAYKVKLTDSSDVEVWTEDDVSGTNDLTNDVSEWVLGTAATFIGVSSFSVAGDQTAIYTVGRRVKIVDSGGTKYGTILSSVYSSVTTVTLDGNSDSLSAAISTLEYGIINPTNTSAPLRTPSTPQVSKSANYTTVLADAEHHLIHPSSDDNPRTFTIDSNANVAYPIGTVLVFINEINTLTIAITSDTLTRAIANTTGSVALNAGGRAVAMKVASTKWVIWGDGLATSFAVPSGTTSQRSGSPATPELRYNTTTGNLEWYDGTDWRPVVRAYDGTIDVTNGGADDTAQWDITNIPSWARRIVLTFRSVSGSSTGSLDVQLGVSGSPETSGYTGQLTAFQAAAVNSVAWSGADVEVTTALAAAAASEGMLILEKQNNGNIWVAKGSCTSPSATYIHSITVGSKSLAGVLNMLRVKLSTGNFDGGTIDYRIEG